MDITQKIDAVTKIDETRISMGGIQLPPKSVKIELTARCNLRCKYCAVSMRKGNPPPDMDLQFFKDITTDMRICGVEEIGLFYLGESFMNPKLLRDCADWVKNGLHFPYVFLTSNATLANKENLKPLLDTGIDSIKWSCNFASSEQFADFTNSNAKFFHNAINNIQQAWKLKKEGNYKTAISASSILYGPDQKAKMDEFLKENIIPYVDRHYWLPLYQMAMYKDHMLKVLGYAPTAGNMGRLDDTTLLPTRKSLPCWSAFTEGHVRADGGLSACCFGADNRFDMGVLNGVNFMKMWNSEKFQKLREAQIKTLTEGQDALKGTPCAVCVAYE
jgi:hypothetical protein